MPNRGRLDKHPAPTAATKTLSLSTRMLPPEWTFRIASVKPAPGFQIVGPVSQPTRRYLLGTLLLFRPTIVADGEVVGTWRRTMKAREIVVEPVLFDRLSGKVREGLAEAAQAFGAFMGRPARLAGLEVPHPRTASRSR